MSFIETDKKCYDWIIMKYIENKILFLGNDTSPLLKWLISVEGFVMQKAPRFDREFTDPSSKLELHDPEGIESLSPW